MNTSHLQILHAGDAIAPVVIRLFARMGVVALDMDEDARTDVVAGVLGAFRNPVNRLRISQGRVLGVEDRRPSDDPTLHLLDIGYDDPACAIDVMRRFSMRLVGNDRLLVLTDTTAIRSDFLDFASFVPVATLIVQ